LVRKKSKVHDQATVGRLGGEANYLIVDSERGKHIVELNQIRIIVNQPQLILDRVE
jgi:hypothetical protein